MQVEIVNRSTMIDKLLAGLVLRPRETAIVTIDMHRGHLDPAVATMAAKALHACGEMLPRSHSAAAAAP